MVSNFKPESVPNITKWSKGWIKIKQEGDTSRKSTNKTKIHSISLEKTLKITQKVQTSAGIPIRQNELKLEKNDKKKRGLVFAQKINPKIVNRREKQHKLPNSISEHNQKEHVGHKIC